MMILAIIDHVYMPTCGFCFMQCCELFNGSLNSFEIFYYSHVTHKAAPFAVWQASRFTNNIRGVRGMIGRLPQAGRLISLIIISSALWSFVLPSMQYRYVIQPYNRLHPNKHVHRIFSQFACNMKNLLNNIFITFMQNIIQLCLIYLEQEHFEHKI